MNPSGRGKADSLTDYNETAWMMTATAMAMAKCQLPLMRPILLTVDMQMDRGRSFKRTAASSVGIGTLKKRGMRSDPGIRFADSFECKNGGYNADWQLSERRRERERGAPLVRPHCFWHDERSLLFSSSPSLSPRSRTRVCVHL